MSIRGYVLTAVALLGAVVNFTSKRISAKTGKSELSIKALALFAVLISVSLLMIFGKG